MRRTTQKQKSAFITDKIQKASERVGRTAQRNYFTESRDGVTKGLKFIHFLH